MIESLTFNTAENKIIVSFTDGTNREYTDPANYLVDFPDRVADVASMGWAALEVAE